MALIATSPCHICKRYKSKADEGLSKLLTFLREEEERERLEEVERLKPIGTPVGHYAVFLAPICPYIISHLLIHFPHILALLLRPTGWLILGVSL